jgi:hypothetical protein
VDEYSDYGLGYFNVEPIRLKDFPNREFSKLFFEFFRFARMIPRDQRIPVDLDKVRQVWEFELSDYRWKASLFERIREQSKRF